MTLVLVVLGWGLAALLALALVGARRRIELAARAEHELRGPLTAIAVGLEALGREPGAGRATLDALDAQLDRVRVGLADLEAARRGRRAGCVASPVALEPLVRAAGRAFGALAARRGGGVEIDWRAGAATVRADRGRVSQALSNLLANAVEHGGGNVRVRALSARGAVRIEVSDSGRGWQEARRPSDRRAKRSDGRERGLAIAARAVEDSGGSLSIRSGEGGSTVALELPLAEA